MKLVIDISEDRYEQIKYMYIHNDSTANEFKNIIMNGVPLMDYLVEHKEKIKLQESEEMIKCCVTCKYHHLDGTKEPCVSCIRNCFSSDDGVTGWERKER